MAACNTLSYKGVTATVFKALQNAGKKQGFAIPSGASGKFTITVVGLNVSFQYAWDQSSGALLLQCVSRPMLVNCVTIKSFADKIVAESGGYPA